MSVRQRFGVLAASRVVMTPDGPMQIEAGEAYLVVAGPREVLRRFVNSIDVIDQSGDAVPEPIGRASTNRHVVPRGKR